MGTLQLSTDTLDWAAANVGSSLALLAPQVVPKSKNAQFLDGQMTFNQAVKLSKLTNVPFGYLFLETPPDLVQATLPDLRQSPNAEPLSHNFYDTLDDVLRKQQWYASYLQETGHHEPDFISRVKQNATASVEAVATDIRKTIGLTDQVTRTASNADKYYNALTELIENVGVLVFRNGIVKSNTRRKLEVKEFRGFAITDRYAPAIFINGNDSTNAWVFTLAHELAHIWTGESGVSDNYLSKQAHLLETEVRCNRIAAELLMPSDLYADKWRQTRDNKYEALSNYFRVSKIAVARKALDLQFIDWDTYNSVDEQLKEKAKNNGGNTYNTAPIRNSKKFTKTLLDRAMSGYTMFREAASLLNVNHNTVVEMGKRMVSRG